MSSSIANPIALPAGDAGQITQSAGVSEWFTFQTIELNSQLPLVFHSRCASTTYRSGIRIYVLSCTPHNPVQQSDLTEVAYLPQGNFNNGYGIENGALAASILGGLCTGTQRRTYYINVFSRDGVSTGNLCLKWEAWLGITNLGPCGVCNPAATGLCKQADVNVTGTGFFSFGVQDPGAYIIQYCGQGAFGSPPNALDDQYYLVYSGLYETLAGVSNGPYQAWIEIPSEIGHNFGSEVNWNLAQLVDLQRIGTGGQGDNCALYVALQPVPATQPTFSEVDSNTYWSAGVIISAGSGAQPDPTIPFYSDNQSYGPGITLQFFKNYSVFDQIPQYWKFTTLTNVPAVGPTTEGSQYWAGGGAPCFPGTNCTFATLCHTGGQIGIYYNGNDGPRAFSLFKFNPSLQIQISVDSIANAGFKNADGSYTYTLTITVTNTSFNYPSGPFTLNLDTALDVFNPSVSQQFNIAANSSIQATFTFNSNGADQLMGRFSFLDCTGQLSATKQTLVLATGIVRIVNANVPNQSCGSTAPLSPYQAVINIANIGQIPISQVNIVSVIPNQTGGCLLSDPNAAVLCNGPFNTTTWSKAAICGPLSPVGQTGYQLNVFLLAAKRTNNSFTQHQNGTLIASFGPAQNPIETLPPMNNLGLFVW